MAWVIQGSYVDIPTYVAILDPILDFVPTFFVLSLLYLIGGAKVDDIYLDTELFEQQWLPIEQPPDQGMAEQGHEFATVHYDPIVDFLSCRDENTLRDT